MLTTHRSQQIRIACTHCFRVLPSVGLAPLMVHKIFETIRAIAAEGVTQLLVEQNAKVALEIYHRGYVMESGTIALADSAPSLLTNPQVRQAYLGE